jgi:hypothetical protein
MRAIQSLGTYYYMLLNIPSFSLEHRSKKDTVLLPLHKESPLLNPLPYTGQDQALKNLPFWGFPTGLILQFPGEVLWSGKEAEDDNAPVRFFIVS